MGEKRYDVRIRAMRQTTYNDLIEKYERPLEEACCVEVGSEWVSKGGAMPVGFCPTAWETIKPFAESLARGEGGFYGDWMKERLSAMVSCNDGFRPMSFLLETMGS